MQRVSGGVAQLGEHLLCKQGVIGSIPFTSTIHLLLREEGETRRGAPGSECLIRKSLELSAHGQAPGGFRFESSNHRLFFNNLVVVDMLFLSGNNDVIASNKQVSVVLEWN